VHVVRAERLSVLQDEVGELLRVLSRFRWRLGFERLLLFGLRGLMGCALAVVGLSLAAWLSVRSDYPLTAYAGLSALPLVAGLALALLRWPSERQAALLADRRYLLDERLGTAVELARRLRGQAPSRRFDRLQIRDAIEQASAAPGGWLLLDERVRREALWALGLTVLAAGSVLLPSLPHPSISGQSQTASSVDAGPADLQQRALPFDAPDPAVADAQPAPPQTQRGANLATRVQQAQAERIALDALSQALGSVSAAQPAADAIQQGDFSTAQQQLSSLGEEADQLSDTAKQQLASALQQAANTTTAADRQLADRERQAAQALGRGNYAYQRQALRSLADQVARSGAQSMPADQLARDVGQLQQQSGQGPAGQGSGVRGQGSGAADGKAAGAQQAGGQGAGPGGQQGGAGIGTGDGGDPLGDTPARLESSGQSVAVPLMLGNGSGVRPPDGSEDQTGSDPTAGARGVSEQAQAQQTGQVAPEQNLVPSEQRPVVRGYFQ
jgi:hypothetical protein